MKRSALAAAAFAASLGTALAARSDGPNFWLLDENVLMRAKYMTHAFEPVRAVWPGFGRASFEPARAGADIPGYVERGQADGEHGFVGNVPADVEKVR